MEKHQPSSNLAIILRILLGLFFIFFAGQKLIDLNSFRETVENYQLIYSPYDRIAAAFIVLLELILGGLLILGNWGYRSALTLTTLLLLGFVAGISSLWIRGININCGCFGQSEEPTNYPLHILFNLALIGLCGFLFKKSGSNKKKVGLQ